MVRAVDDILRTEFGFADGLADTATKTIMEHVEGKKNRKSFSVPAIQILDPATGTGTFLREVILNIYDTFRCNHKGESEEEIKKQWNEYVPKHLLQRLNGFELMMAPYAVAHMKLAMVLKETGYEFESNQRLNVLLTNSLEPSASKASFMETEGQQLSMFEDPLAAEAYDADKTKNNLGINVIIGNPPYSISSTNRSSWILDLLSDYKKGLNERKVNLDDDYIKFIRFGQYVINKSQTGILAFITNNSFLDGITHRKMRCDLLTQFNSLYIINLHGNSKRHEVTPNGTQDENVFDIQQGVCILIFTKNNSSEKHQLLYTDLWGERNKKYSTLCSKSIDSIEWKTLAPDSETYYFVPKNLSETNDYKSGIKTSDLLVLTNSGIQTKNDKLAIRDTEKEMQIVYDDFISLSRQQLVTKYGLKDSAGWKIDKAISDLKEHKVNIIDIIYRTFDTKKTIYTGISSGFLGRPRDKLTCHFLHDNIGILLRRNTPPVPFTHVFITNNMISEGVLGIDPNGRESVFPLYRYSEELGKTVRTPNLNSEIVKEISEKLGLPFAPDSDGGNTDSFAPIDLLDYIYAVLHSPKYRETYKEFLKIDFPRVPYPTDKEMFWKMVKLGGEIRKLHLMESPLLDTLITRFPLNGSNEVEKITRKENRVYINKTQYFEGVSDLAWNFYIGGYQPLQKWLKDRKGRTLSDEDIIHYQKIVVALTETDRLMKEIDKVFIFGEDVENVKV